MSNGQRSVGNFSNGNRDTFDPAKQYLGVRLQQGVPILDRDWNELEDIRRHYQRMLGKYYLGDGVPSGVDGFKIDPPPSASPNDFTIRAGRCLVDGYDAVNGADALYSSQGLATLPVPTAATKFVVYLEVWEEPVTASEDPALRNSQDINLETCLRDQLRWAVRVAEWPHTPGARASYVLASIDRPANAPAITGPMITDLRRHHLTLADVVDIAANLAPRVQALEGAVATINQRLTDIDERLGRLFWDVDMRAAKTSAHFGEAVAITITATNALGPVAGVRVEFSTDYGFVTPARAVTNSQGQATATILGVEADREPDDNDRRVLTQVAGKVANATRTDRTVFYSAIKFQPEEIGILSKYTPAAALVDIDRDLVNIPAIPPSKTATVTCYAKEGAGTVVRGIGTAQITYSQWVRDWGRSKIADTIREVDVGARVGAKFGAAWNRETTDLDVNRVKNGILEVYDDLADEVQGRVAQKVFEDILPAEETRHAGILAESIAVGVTNQVGQKTHQAVTNQVATFQDQGLPAAKGTTYQKTILQEANRAQAGLAQGQRVTFGAGRG
ncbi:MAG TPA: DUF6519 domain-containing protein [Chloroflexota bacterium]|jgi:hypothetical protein